jgi:cytochrome c oxidase subunit II
MPRQGSTLAPGVDALFDFILVVSVVFFALIVALMLLFVIRYRRRRMDQEPLSSPHHNARLEATWSIVPLLIVFVIFGWGFKLYLDENVSPRNAYEIDVTGQKWKWLFTYPNGHVDEELHVPGDRPVKLVMTSEDVIHSFFVPAFRLKRDAVPGRYSVLWFTAAHPGVYQAFCAEYCGMGHSNMLAKVVVHEPGGFERWLEQASNLLATMTPVEAGGKLYAQRGCIQCHTVDGSARVGPSFKGVFGHMVLLQGGDRVMADENYVRESILDPQAKVVAGYEPVMPTYKGRIKDSEITAIIAYLKSLSK